MGFITEKKRVYCAVRNETLHVIQVKFILQMITAFNIKHDKPHATHYAKSLDPQTFCIRARLQGNKCWHLANLALSTSVLQASIQVNGSLCGVVTNLGVIHHLLTLFLKCSLLHRACIWVAFPESLTIRTAISEDMFFWEFLYNKT
jgi:hypothetical protein